MSDTFWLSKTILALSHTGELSYNNKLSIFRGGPETINKPSAAPIYVVQCMALPKLAAHSTHIASGICYGSQTIHWTKRLRKIQVARELWIWREMLLSALCQLVTQVQATHAGLGPIIKFWGRFFYSDFVTGPTLTTSPSQKKCPFHWQWGVMLEIWKVLYQKVCSLSVLWFLQVAVAKARYLKLNILICQQLTK